MQQQVMGVEKSNLPSRHLLFKNQQQSFYNRTYAV
jgi:hypothetical protein